MAKIATSTGADPAVEPTAIPSRGTTESVDDLAHPDSDLHAAGVPVDDSDGWAFATRLFGWSMIWLLFAYMVSTVLTLSFGWPGPGFLSPLGIVQALIYIGAVALALFIAQRERSHSLRSDAEAIHRFNTYLVRGAFFAVLFVGIGDVVVSFLRVEGFLDGIVGPALASDLGRSAFRGPWFHVPLVALGFIVAAFARTLGFHWLALLIVVAELAIVITRFVFSYEQAFMGDLVRFWYAALFLFASAYTLIQEGHVRVDILYAGFSDRRKGTVNAIGTILLGITLCWTIIVIGFNGPSAIVYGVVARFEISQSGFGLYVKYMMAAFLAVFAVTMLFQFVAYLFDAVADRRGRPGSRIAGAAAAAH